MEQSQRQRSGTQGAGAVYGLGLIGAVVWYWKQANGFKGHFGGVLKALVWPAFLVYDAFKKFSE